MCHVAMPIKSVRLFLIFGQAFSRSGHTDTRARPYAKKNRVSFQKLFSFTHQWRTPQKPKFPKLEFHGSFKHGIKKRS